VARDKKKKYEQGLIFDKNFHFPEVLYQERPSIVPSPWRRADLLYRLRAAVETPLKKVKRKVLSK
jgi:hypothetical protein